MKQKQDWRRLVYVICVILALMSSFCSKPDGSDNPNQATIYGDGWGITGVRGQRSSGVGRIDGTKELIYITYSQEPYIDVYDLTGAFQYTIMLPDSQNGVVAIDCRDGMLIAAAKGNNSKGHDVFLFRGTELVDSMDYDQALEQGYVPIWDDRVSDYLLTKTHVILASGEELFKLPPELAENMPMIVLNEQQEQLMKIPLLVGFAALFLSILGLALGDIFKKDRKSYH